MVFLINTKIDCFIVSCHSSPPSKQCFLSFSTGKYKKCSTIVPYTFIISSYSFFLSSANFFLTASARSDESGTAFPLTGSHCLLLSFSFNSSVFLKEQSCCYSLNSYCDTVYILQLA